MIEDMIRDEKLQYQVLRHRGGWGVGADGAMGGGGGRGGGGGYSPSPRPHFFAKQFFFAWKTQRREIKKVPNLYECRAKHTFLRRHVSKGPVSHL